MAHDLDLPFEDQRFESRPFEKIKRDYLVNDERVIITILPTHKQSVANVAIANAYEVAYWLSIGIFTFDLGSSKGQGQCHSQFDCEKFENLVMLHFVVSMSTLTFVVFVFLLVYCRVQRISTL